MTFVKRPFSNPSLYSATTNRRSHTIQNLQQVVTSCIFIGALYLLVTSLSNSCPFTQTTVSRSNSASYGTTAGLDKWIVTQEALSYDQILLNIGQGERAKSAALGAVLGSPSTDNPNYYYQLVRDAAIIYKTVIGCMLSGMSRTGTLQDDNDKRGNESLAILVSAWARSQDVIQRSDNPSGGYHTGGLGEPKFHVDNDAFLGAWGRPQNDGPAIRATALMIFAKRLVELENDSELLKILYTSEYPANSVIKADLEFIAGKWFEDSFDLWEEVSGLHFFTLMVQRRAMLDGAAFAVIMGDHGAAKHYAHQAEAMSIKLKEFWSAEDGWIVSTLGKPFDRSGLDCGTILGSLHGMSSSQEVYNPHSDEMLATLHKYVETMKAQYGINQGNGRLAMGRYPEDIYDGYDMSLGNPWYICTAASAQQLYTAAQLLEESQRIKISSISEEFFQQFLPSARAGNDYTFGSRDFGDMLQGMRNLGDVFMSTIRRYARSNGSLSEQFNRDTGEPQGARDLTWSYGAFITAAQARRGEVPL